MCIAAAQEKAKAGKPIVREVMEYCKNAAIAVVVVAASA